MNTPTILTLFGATGDLANRKVYPALYRLSLQGRLPRLFQVVAFARRPYSNDEYRAEVRKSLELHVAHLDAAAVDAFLSTITYQQGQFDDVAAYASLAERFGMVDGQWNACSNKLFYLAVPPQYVDGIITNLAHSHLTEPCSNDEGWTRVIVEKPFGSDAMSAQALDTKLSALFKEEQIYRIDHYLGKEMFQNVLALRFSNNLFESVWNHDDVESIDIRFFEAIGVEGRGAFYDAVGALRDVGQNHLLEMLALATMTNPGSYAVDAVRASRAEILRALNPDAATTVRAQYHGYRDIAGVEPASDTETYFRITTELNHPRWQGVPVTIEGGKRVGETCKEVLITFRHPVPCLCPPGSPHHKNTLRISFEPVESIDLSLWIKKPGLSFEMTEHVVNLLHGQDADDQRADAYDRLILDCIMGDQTLFMTTDEVTALWAFIDPIRRAWDSQSVPLTFYDPDTKPLPNHV